MPAGVIIGPAPAPETTPGTSLPSDEVLLELALVNAIENVFRSIPNLTTYVNIQGRERYPETDEDDILVATVPDQIVRDLDRTSLIQIGIPTVEEFQYTSDLSTQVNFTYPMTFDLEVVDNWDNALLPYKNSRQLLMAVYMVSRRAFKNNRTLGFNNVETQYLQQINVGLVDEEETGRIHAIDWELTVKTTGILV